MVKEKTSFAKNLGMSNKLSAEVAKLVDVRDSKKGLTVVLIIICLFSTMIYIKMQRLFSVSA